MRKFKAKNLPIFVEQATDKLYRGFNNLTGIRYRFPPELIENSNDWEEIIEKNYEILSFKDSIGNIYTHSYTKDKTKYAITLDGVEYTKEQLLDCKDNSIKIYSVKRLSDKEVFTIGDRVNRYRTIVKFNFIENMIYAYLTDDTGVNIINLQHHKGPLFITEDGIEIFDKGTKVIGLYKSTLEKPYSLGDSIGVWLNGWYTISEIPNPNENDKNVLRIIKEKFLIFSTEEAAQNYIIENKPCLSLKDFYFLSHCQAEEERTYNKLKELVKSKLNL